jgi:hypothetical protein
MAFGPPARHLLRAKDLADARYFEPLGVDDLARAVEFVEQPEERPYGIDSSVRDSAAIGVDHEDVRSR